MRLRLKNKLFAQSHLMKYAPPNPCRAMFILTLCFNALIGCQRADFQNGVSFDTVPIKPGDLTQVATASGTLGAVISVDVGSQISGQIQALYADYNSSVKRNQLVAQIDPSIYQAAVNESKAQLASSLASRDIAKINARRARELAIAHAGSQSDADKADAELRQTEATVMMNQATLDKAAADLDHCHIVSPIDGVVITRKVDPGQTVAAAMTTPVLFTIAQDITKMQIVANVSEADIGEVKPGQSVEFRVDAFPGEIFQGVVSQVRRSASTTENVVTYGVVIEVENPKQKLFPGMTAEVSIFVAERRGVLTVANTALRFIPPENAKFDGGATSLTHTSGQRLVYQRGDNGTMLKPVLVKIGITDGMNSELLQGLKDGDLVVTAATVPGKKSFAPPPGGPPQ
jgi:HlyD family secretion protein